MAVTPRAFEDFLRQASWTFNSIVARHIPTLLQRKDKPQRTQRKGRNNLNFSKMLFSRLEVVGLALLSYLPFATFSSSFFVLFAPLWLIDSTLFTIQFTCEVTRIEDRQVLYPGVLQNGRLYPCRDANDCAGGLTTHSYISAQTAT